MKLQNGSSKAIASIAGVIRAGCCVKDSMPWIEPPGFVAVPTSTSHAGSSNGTGPKLWLWRPAST